MSANIRGLFHTVALQMKLSMARAMFQFIIFAQPFLFATIGYLIYGTSSAEKMFHYVVLGSGFITLWSSILFSSASDVNRERFYGTLELIFVAPISFAVTLIGKIIGNMILGIFSMVISFVYLLVVFHVEMHIYHLGMFLLAFLAVLFSLCIFAFFLAMGFTLSRQASALMNMMEYPIFFLCGFLFPITFLPIWLQPLSWMLPPTWGIQLLREISKPELTAMVGKAWLGLGINTIVYALLSVILYRMMEHKVRKLGNLGVY